MLPGVAAGSDALALVDPLADVDVHGVLHQVGVEGHGAVGVLDVDVVLRGMAQAVVGVGLAHLHHPAASGGHQLRSRWACTSRRPIGPGGSRGCRWRSTTASGSRPHLPGRGGCSRSPPDRRSGLASGRRGPSPGAARGRRSWQRAAVTVVVVARWPWWPAERSAGAVGGASASAAHAPARSPRCSAAANPPRGARTPVTFRRHRDSPRVADKACRSVGARRRAP